LINLGIPPIFVEITGIPKEFASQKIIGEQSDFDGKIKKCDSAN